MNSLYTDGVITKHYKFWKRIYSNVEYAIATGKLKKVN